MTERKRKGRPPLSLHGRMATVTVAITEEQMAEVERLVAQGGVGATKAEVLRYLVGLGMRTHNSGARDGQ